MKNVIFPPMIFSQWDQFKWGDDEEWLQLLVETQDFSKPANNVGNV